MIDFYPLLRPLLFAFAPERAHSLTLAALKTGLLRQKLRLDPAQAQSLRCQVAGLNFANPLGMAAGFDKNAEVANAVLRLGFGFTEIGTVTPKPQPGNPRPRLFRLAADQAVINRMGFNNHGHQAAYKRLSERLLAGTRVEGGIVGVNIGANKDSEDKIADYTAGLSCFYTVADYFTINISSPNTPGLRNLQQRPQLRRLLAAALAARAGLAAEYRCYRPIFLKIAPDLSEQALDDIAAEFMAAPLDGLIISNTTISRPGLQAGAALAAQAGGLSGRPLFPLATLILAKMRLRLGKNVPLIGAGGIDSVETALAKIAAGADLLQLYTALVYRGAGLVPRLAQGLARACAAQGVSHISELRDKDAAKLAAEPLPAMAG